MEDQCNGRKLSKSASGLRMIPVSDTYACPFAVAEPIWVPDTEASECMSCKKPFDFFKRKHHCRRCGNCFCDACCHYIIPLKRMYFIDPVRHCYDCAIISKAESDFYDKTLKILVTGYDFAVYKGITDDLIGLYKCYFSQDNRYIQFQAQPQRKTNQASPPRVLLSKIIEAKFATGLSDGPSPTKIPTGVTLKFKDDVDSIIIHDLRFVSVDKKGCIPWLASLQKALKILFETRESNSS